MTTKSILLIPPFIKYNAGPLLGPSLLQSAARSCGYSCDVIDLNAMYIQPRAAKRIVTGKFVGDHDKPKGPRSLASVENEFMNIHLISALEQTQSFNKYSEPISSKELTRRAKYGFLTHDQIANASIILAEQQFGCYVKDILTRRVSEPPDVIGVSLLHSGQVIPAAAITNVIRKIWPQALVVWGGPHISGLGKDTIAKDLHARHFAADVFVTGHAEETFVWVLDEAKSLKSATSNLPVVLKGKSKVVSPTFDDLTVYDVPLTFPAQSTIGCAYGRCSYCTYPNIEGKPQKLDLLTSVGSVVDQAERLPGSTLSMKDSLVTPMRLIELSDCIQNRVRWSACTKLTHRLDTSRLTQLTESGLATLEVGLESLLPESQRMINKIQPLSTYEEFLNTVADLPHELSIVVNYMIGFPWEDPEAAQSKLNEAENLLQGILGKNRGLIELNRFELERLAPMAKFPEAFGIDPSRIRAWPWASVLEMEKSIE